MYHLSHPPYSTSNVFLLISDWVKNAEMAQTRSESKQKEDADKEVKK
jgi:hypothetical protein